MCGALGRKCTPPPPPRETKAQSARGKGIKTNQRSSATRASTASSNAAPRPAVPMSWPRLAAVATATPPGLGWPPAGQQVAAHAQQAR